MTCSTSVESAPFPTPRRQRRSIPAAAVCCILIAVAGSRVAAGTGDAPRDSRQASAVTTTPFATTAEATSDEPAQVATEPDGRPEDGPAGVDGSPRWIDAVRAQRQAAQRRIRAHREARRRAIDPVGSARQEAHDQQFQRRRRELRERIAEDRKLFLNSGPWQTPWPRPPEFAPGVQTPGSPRNSNRAMAPPGGALEEPRDQPPEWDNGWYYRGW